MKTENLEKQILGIIKIDSNVIDEYCLTDDIFFIDTHKKIFNLMKGIHDKGIKIDEVVLWQEAIKDQSLSPSYIAELGAMTSANAKYYIDKQKEIVRLERIRLLGLHIADWIKDGKDSKEIINLIDEQITNINGLHNSVIIYAKDRVHSVVQQIEDLYKSGGKINGISCGFNVFDFYTNGFQREDFIIIGARPSAGKTSMMLNFLANMTRLGIMCGMFTLEMSVDALLMRIISSEAEINSNSMKNGKLRNSDFGKIADAANMIYESNIIMDSTNDPTFSIIKSQSRKMVRMGAKIIFIDYLTLINWRDFKLSKIDAFGEISKGMKALARELKVPFIVLSQLNRDAEGREPTMANLRETGNLEQDADTIIFLWNENNSDDKNKNVKNITNVSIAKQRNGATGKFTLEFVKEYTKFRQIYDEE